jgi:hypothetical protein
MTDATPIEVYEECQYCDTTLAAATDWPFCPPCDRLLGFTGSPVSYCADCGTGPLLGTTPCPRCTGPAASDPTVASLAAARAARRRS